jgi:hypothetical protein
MPLDMSEFESDNTYECKIAKIKSELNPEQLEKLEYAFIHKYTTYAIRKVLNEKWGYRIATQTINKHRLGKCSCEGSANV